MATYYVKANGSNAANGTSDGTAWQTLDYALTQYASGDTILVRKGDTISAPNKSFRITKSGVTLGSYDGGNGTENPVFDGEQAGDPAWPGVIDVQAVNVTIDGVDVINAMRKGIYADIGSDGFLVRNCNVDWAYYAGIQARECNGVLFDSNKVANAASKRITFPTGGWPTCMSCRTCANVQIRNNIILNGHGEGINVYENCTEVVIEDNYVAGPRAIGIYVEVASGVVVRRNLLITTTTSPANDGYAGGGGLAINNESYHFDNGLLAPDAVNHNIEFTNNLVSGYNLGIAIYGQYELSDYRGIKFHNNVFVDCEYAIGDYVNNAKVRPNGIEIINNIFAGPMVGHVDGGDTSNILNDYNCWYSAPDKHIGQNDIIASVTLARTSGWRDQPDETVIKSSDFLPVEGSANYGAGVDVGLATDYYGNEYIAPFDIGPFSSNTEVPNPELPSEIITLAFRSAGATVSNLVAANVQHTEASAYITTSSATGDIFAVVTESATPPSAADIEAGTGISADTLTITVSGQQGPLLFTGLPLDTDLWVHAVQDTGSYSSVLTTAFRTLKPTLYNAGIDIDPTTKVGTLVVESDYPVGTTVYAAWYSGAETDKTALEVISGTAGALGSANVPANNENVFTVPAQADNMLYFAKFVQQVD